MREFMKKQFLLIAILLTIAGMAIAGEGIKKKSKQYDYGSVKIDNFSSKAGFGPVVFDHWVHRSRYTCRLCHIDLGFSMKANGTGITAADNMKGVFCGTCHNGKMKYKSDIIFQACTKEFTKGDTKTCERCHQYKRDARRQQQVFDKATQLLPKARFGNGINWAKAEQMGMITLVDQLEGVSIKMDPLPIQKDFSITSKIGGMPDIIFSHQKHTVMIGCEICHPDIFTVKKGMTKFSMTEMFDGKYCGVCHDSVAFPQMDCQRCHSKSVQ